MKKLIALVGCLAVMAVFARAEYSGQNVNKKDINKEVATQVNMKLRVVEMKIYPSNNPAEAYSGKAVILKFNENFSQVTLLMNNALSDGVELIRQNSEAPILGKITNGMIKPAEAAELKYFKPFQVQRNNRPEVFLQVTLPVGALKGNNKHNAQLMNPVPAQQAAKLL